MKPCDICEVEPVQRTVVVYGETLMEDASYEVCLGCWVRASEALRKAEKTRWYKPEELEKAGFEVGELVCVSHPFAKSVTVAELRFDHEQWGGLPFGFVLPMPLEPTDRIARMAMPEPPEEE